MISLHGSSAYDQYVASGTQFVNANFEKLTESALKCYTCRTLFETPQKEKARVKPLTGFHCTCLTGKSNHHRTNL